MSAAETLTVEGMPRDGPPCSCAATSSPPQTRGLPKQSTVCSTIVASWPHVMPCRPPSFCHGLSQQVWKLQILAQDESAPSPRHTTRHKSPNKMSFALPFASVPHPCSVHPQSLLVRDSSRFYMQEAGILGCCTPAAQRRRASTGKRLRRMAAHAAPGASRAACAPACPP